MTQPQVVINFFNRAVEVFAEDRRRYLQLYTSNFRRRGLAVTNVEESCAQFTATFSALMAATDDPALRQALVTSFEAALRDTLAGLALPDHPHALEDIGTDSPSWLGAQAGVVAAFARALDVAGAAAAGLTSTGLPARIAKTATQLRADYPARRGEALLEKESDLKESAARLPADLIAGAVARLGPALDRRVEEAVFRPLEAASRTLARPAAVTG